MLLTKMDQLGKPAWAFAAVFGFWLFWPLGLAVLAYLVWTGRLRAMRDASDRWSNPRCDSSGRGRPSDAAPSGNRAFDDYRAETLRRLEREQREFAEYLDHLRRARDKAEFDRFMAERRNRDEALPTVGAGQALTKVAA